MVIELFKCPCCEGAAKTHRIPTWTDNGIRHTYFLSCIDCGYGPTVSHNTEKEAMDCWNHQIMQETIPC